MAPGRLYRSIFQRLSRLCWKLAESAAQVVQLVLTRWLGPGIGMHDPTVVEGSEPISNVGEFNLNRDLMHGITLQAVHIVVVVTLEIDIL